MRPRSAVGWAVLLLGVPAVVWSALAVIGYQPRPLPIALLSALGVVTLTVLGRAVKTQDAPWPSGAARSDVADKGADPRLLHYVRAIENHRDARQVDSSILRALAVLARARLERIDVALGDARSRELLGDDLVDALCEPTPRRLSLSEIDRCLRRIENT